MVEENCDIVWGDDWSINISGFNNCIQRCSSNCVVGPIVCIFIIPVLKHYHIWIKTSCDYTHLWFFFFACWTATLWWNLKLRFISRMLPFILLILCSIPLLKYIGGKLNWLCLMWHYKYCFTQGLQVFGEYKKKPWLWHVIIATWLSYYNPLLLSLNLFYSIFYFLNIILIRKADSL